MKSSTLVNTTTRHAFYIVVQRGTSVFLNFGRLGTKGRMQRFDFADKRSATDFFEEKVECKLERNYELVRAA